MVFWIPCKKEILKENCGSGFSNIIWNDLKQ
jgi:hypothetical protein